MLARYRLSQIRILKSLPLALYAPACPAQNLKTKWANTNHFDPIVPFCSVSIFVESNQEDEETTKIQKIILLGST